MSVDTVEDLTNNESRRLFDEHYVQEYDETKRAVARLLVKERGDISVSATDVVHDIYPKFRKAIEGTAIRCWHAFRDTVIRNYLVERARRRSAKKRGGHLKAVSLKTAEQQHFQTSNESLVEFCDELQKLEAIQPRKAKFVRLCLAGWTTAEICGELSISKSTVSNWRNSVMVDFRDKYL